MIRVSLGFLSAAAAAEHGVDVATMWREVEAHCAAGRCAVGTGSKLDAIANTTDCKGRLLGESLTYAIHFPSRGASHRAIALTQRTSRTSSVSIRSATHSVPRTADRVLRGARARRNLRCDSAVGRTQAAHA